MRVLGEVSLCMDSLRSDPARPLTIAGCSKSANYVMRILTACIGPPVESPSGSRRSQAARCALVNLSWPDLPDTPGPVLRRKRCPCRPLSVFRSCLSDGPQKYRLCIRGLVKHPLAEAHIGARPIEANQ